MKVAPVDPQASVFGFVLKAFVRCEGRIAVDGNAVCTVADPTGTRLNIRDAPNGKATGSLANGTHVRGVSETRHNGRAWLEIEVLPDDNAIGFAPPRTALPADLAERPRMDPQVIALIRAPFLLADLPL